MSVSGGKLRIRVQDGDDLRVLSSLLQDAIIPAADMAYLPDQREFVMVANRFRWEALTPGPSASFERINCGIRFAHVDRVRSRAVGKQGDGDMLTLLTIQYDPDAVLLQFAGGGDVRLEIAGLLAHIEDIGEPWPTGWRPRHPEDEQD